MRGRASSQTKKKSSCFYFNRFRYRVVSCVKIRPLKVFNLGYFNIIFILIRSFEEPSSSFLLRCMWVEISGKAYSTKTVLLLLGFPKVNPVSTPSSTVPSVAGLLVLEVSEGPFS